MTNHVSLAPRSSVRSTYYELINSLHYKECNEALIRIKPRINMTNVEKMIDSINEISKIRKRFYKEILLVRYQKMIENPFEKLTGDR